MISKITKFPNRAIVVDTETTGLAKYFLIYYSDDEIIEIAGMEVINCKITGLQYHSFVKTDHPVNPEARKVHQISDEYFILKVEL